MTRILTISSVVTVICTLSVVLYGLPQLIVTGEIEFGPFIHYMVVYPTLIGLIAAPIGAVAGLVAFFRWRSSGYPALTMSSGQMITCGLAIAIAVWATNFGTTGWELLLIPASLVVGQMIVAAGLVSQWIIARRKPANPVVSLPDAS